MTELKQRKGEIELMKIASLVENQMKFYNVKGNKNTNIKQMDVDVSGKKLKNGLNILGLLFQT